MIAQTLYLPPNGVAPVAGDVIKHDLLWPHELTVIEVLQQVGPAWLIRVEGEDPQPVCRP